MSKLKMQVTKPQDVVPTSRNIISKLPTNFHRLKVYPKWVRRMGHNPFVPMILLKGEWLRKAGFDCESHVIIAEKYGKLIITIERD